METKGNKILQNVKTSMDVNSLAIGSQTPNCSSASSSKPYNLFLKYKDISNPIVHKKSKSKPPYRKSTKLLSKEN
jgi:hypothetical protein